jgi:hypothetical protein
MTLKQRPREAWQVIFQPQKISIKLAYSITKPIVSVLVVKLPERERLSLLFRLSNGILASY